MIGGRNISPNSGMLHQQQQRRFRSLALLNGETRGEEALDLFSSTRRSKSISAGDESERNNSKVPPNLTRISVGSARSTRKGSDDLLSTADTGKHDYDWLLTPPGSPLHSSLDFMDDQQSSIALKPNISARSSSATKISRRAAPNSNGGRIPARTPAARSSSVARAAIHTSRPSTPAAGATSRTSSLNTSTSSAASSRPSTPKTRPGPLQPQARPTSGSRPSTPAKTRPASSSRPSTPTARPQLPNSSYRPSTPTSLSVTSGAARPTQKPGVPSDFSLIAPVNLRTRLPERPVSANRSRSGVPLTAAPAIESTGRRLPASPARSRLPSITKLTPATAGSGGFGRTISKNSLDMALLHMDIRQGTGVARGTSLFPPSVRSTAPRTDQRPISPEMKPLPPSARAIGRDIYESSRYDTILLKEDVRNMSWLHSGEDKSDQGLIFDLRLEPLPEPFVLSPVKNFALTR